MLLPGLLLVGFAARRHRALFRLREMYLYKFTVAASLAGFKGEAPEHEQAVAAAAFEQLLFNPVTYMEKEEPPSRKDGRLRRWLKKIIKDAWDEMQSPKDPG